MKYLILLTLLSFNAYAEDTNGVAINYGIGVGKSGDNGLTNTKFVSIYKQKPLIGDFLIQRYELGGWIDPNSDQGRKSSGYLGWSGGFHTMTSNGFYANALTGVAVLSTTDAFLGSHAQFHETCEVGIKGTNDLSTGLAYHHISDASIFPGPNAGRDFLTFSVMLPF